MSADATPPGPGIERKLTTILAADVAGYSTHMAEDEASTMAALREARAIFGRLIERHRGRIANTAGDSVIAEFPSTVEAVQCAVETQNELAARHAADPAARALTFRIGVHLGDVMVDGGDLFGEGVNVAARLEQAAPAGGVLVSRQVFEQVRRKIPVAFDPIDPAPLRARGVDTDGFRVVMADGAPETGAAARPAAAGAAAGLFARLAHDRGLVTVAILVALMFAINLLSGIDTLWFQWPSLGIAAVFVLRRVRGTLR